MSSSLIDLVFHYFPFLAGGVSLLNLLIIQKRVSLVAQKYLVLLSALFFVWGVLQVIGGYSTFLFVMLPPNQHPLVALFWLIYFISVWGSAIWVIWGNGANELLKNGLVYGNENLKTPQNIKLFFAVASILFPLLVTLGYVSGLFSNAVIDLQVH